ncbi:MAG: TIGR03364 family FAD-dependent oxidoreductase [Microscillaceae bacterium]|nr:TIGR03364 family FAD-dependent oxidoreductase [Microscillaceae bacterium]
MNQIQKSEIAIVGAGIVGLSLALSFAKRGHQVRVFERNTAAVGASVRNFGLIWPIGQKDGHLYKRALKSREVWQELASQSSIHLNQNGSIHLAYHQDEWKILQEFFQQNPYASETCQLLSASEVLQKSAAANPEGLLGGLWSTTEMTVDPREAIPGLASYLQDRYKVDFKFGHAVTDISYPQLKAGGRTWEAEKIFVCSGADFETLYPEIFAQSGITKCKLQMMRSEPQPKGWLLGPSLCAGLTLTHYASFEDCPTLPALKARIQEEMPEYVKWGIHVLLNQNALGELVIGDSHEYGWNPSPFDQEKVNQYILTYLQKFARLPSLQIKERWQGVYPKIPGQTELIRQPEQGVMIVNALSGAGMTLSMGLAEHILEQF